MSRFARPELERRWLLPEVPPGEVVRVVEIEDRYLPGPGLRLRRMTSADGEQHKLTQKVPTADGGPGTLTTIYLTAQQASTLQVIEGYLLRKRRLSIPPYGVDVFSGPLEGLLLAEAEVLTSPEDLAALADPPGALAEVTRDLRFSGGSLAVTSAEDLRRALATYGL